MTAPLQFLASPLAHALLHTLGWTLLHFCWQAAIVAIVLWSILQLMVGRSSQARYAAACCALLLLVALPLLTFTHLAAADFRNAYAPLSTSANDFTLAIPAGPGVPSTPWPARLAFAVDRGMPWLLALWLTGAIFFVARLNYGLLVAHRLKSQGTHPPSTELLRMFEELKHLLRINRAVLLLHSARVQVPTVVGWLRPVVLIPASCLSGLSTQQIEAILCHELAHIRRHDYLVSVLQSVAEALLFYHPAVWWVSRQIRRERECCCDEIAVANGADVLTYARALSHLEEHRPAFPEFVLGANGGALSMRIRRLLGYKAPTQASQFAALTLLALMTAVAGSLLATMARAQIHSATLAARLHDVPLESLANNQLLALHSQPEFQLASVVQQPQALATTDQPGDKATLHGIYKTWLDEDVVYIITPQERTTYLALANDDERDTFINQFWAHRNPAGSAPGTFREQHYSRIAYANEHFASNTKSGWRTERGRIYILYGKPDSIDSHPSGGGGSPSPSESWHYNSVPGLDSIITFTDSCRCGEYSDYSVHVSDAPEATLVSPEIIAQQLISSAKPVYPEIANAAHVQGKVVLQALIGKDGTVKKLRVVSGPAMLTASALDAVKQWKYDPYLVNGQPVEVFTTVGVDFTLPATSPRQVVSFQPQARTVEYDGPPLRKIGGGVTAPVPVATSEPQYSAEARQARFNGIVLVNLIVDQNGQPQNVHVLRGVGMGLDEKAVDAVRQYRFKPAMDSGKPVPVALNIEVNFQIFGSPKSQSLPSGPSSDAERALNIPEGTTAPIVIHQVEPDYTKAARKAKKSGVVLLSVTVDQQGNPQNVHVVRSLDNGLDKKAVEAVRQYRFKPATKDHQPIAASLNIEVNFQIF